jgi:enamine deaminase RidA (YjgF/YER057c/UK114 family)
MSQTFEVVKTEAAPKPLPQFSQAVKYNGMVYCSGNIGLLPGEDFQLVEGTVKDRAVRLFETCLALFPALITGTSIETSTEESIGHSRGLRKQPSQCSQDEHLHHKVQQFRPDQ